MENMRTTKQFNNITERVIDDLKHLIQLFGKSEQLNQM